MSIPKLFASVTLCLFVAYLGSLITIPAITTWYVTLHKPFFTPPNWLFGPVWSVLYLLMGISFYLVWEKGIKSKSAVYAVKVFLVQLVLNYFWSVAFFALHNPHLAFLVILCLWGAIFYTICLFMKRSKVAAFLLYPYIFWVSFALLLNLFIVALN